jgi:hypothetical protein
MTECGCDERPAERRRFLVCRLKVGLALWGDGGPEGTEWRLVAHSLGRGLRPKRSECRNSGSTMCQTHRVDCRRPSEASKRTAAGGLGTCDAGIVERKD